MGTILIAWELGAGMGHIARYVPLVPHLRARGHRVVFALRDLRRAPQLLDPVGAAYLPAPFQSTPPRTPLEPTHTYPQLLHNVGYEEPEELLGLVKAWRNLLHLVQPDLVICDHSPTALVALRGMPLKRIAMGTGFTIPPDVYPLPNIHPWEELSHERIVQDESRILAVVNRVLDSIDQGPLDRIGQLFSQVDATLLTTLRELDHYPHRASEGYWGFAPPPPGTPVEWTASPRRKVLAYLKPFPLLPVLLELLAKLELPTIVVADGIDARCQQKYRTAMLQFTNRHVDLMSAIHTCYMVVTNATHSTTSMALLAGNPVLMFPLTLEQEVFARRVVELGAGALVPLKQERDVYQQVANLMNDDRFTMAAARFASTYRGHDAASNVERWACRVDDLLGGS